MNSIEQKVSKASAAFNTLGNFIGLNQLTVMVEGACGEEKEYFIDKIIEMADVVSKMPKIYEQDGKGDEAIVHLHYFTGSMDWFITERDFSAEQAQAFGYADHGHGGELGYISVAELIVNNVELDLHWKPVTLSEVKSRKVA